MHPSYETQTSAGYGLSLQVRNRVLRNTYLLLALSMIPTALGAYIGVRTGIANGLTGFMGLAVFFGGAFAFMFAIEKTKHSSLGVALLLAFTFFMGVMLSRMLSWVLGFGNGPQLVITAFLGTAAVFATMATIATTTKRDFSGAGRWLMVGFVVLLVSSLLNFFIFQSPALMMALSTFAIAIFSFWLMYDIKRIVDGGETNYISATLSLYLSLYNIFQNLLMLLGIFGGDE